MGETDEEEDFLFVARGKAVLDVPRREVVVVVVLVVVGNISNPSPKCFSFSLESVTCALIQRARILERVLSFDFGPFSPYRITKPRALPLLTTMAPSPAMSSADSFFSTTTTTRDSVAATSGRSRRLLLLARSPTRCFFPKKKKKKKKKTSPNGLPRPRFASRSEDDAENFNPDDNSYDDDEKYAVVIDAPGWSGGFGTGGKVWSSSKVLSKYLLEEAHENAKFNENENIIELGCGTGYLGISAAKALRSRSLTLTDGGTEALLKLCEENARQNGIENVAACKLEWGVGKLSQELRERVEAFRPSIILASDCTYERKAHEAFCDSIVEILELARVEKEEEEEEEEDKVEPERRKRKRRPDQPRVLLAHQHRTFASLLNGFGFGSSFGVDPNFTSFLDTCRAKGLRVAEVRTEKLAFHGLKNVSIVSITK